MRHLISALILVSFLAIPVYAGPKAGKGSDKNAAADSQNAGDRIANETADAVADVLTGEDAKPQPAKGTMPPGLAKKDKTPPGWDKGNKTGWDKEAPPPEDSPIKKFIKSVFGQK